MSGLGARLALALQARALQARTEALYRRSEHTARTLQQSLLPAVIPNLPSCELAVRFAPAGAGDLVGGDFYDVFAVGDEHWAVVIGDVCGKGAQAAAVTAMARWTLRSFAGSPRSPADVLRSLNAAMLRQDLDGRFITVIYALLARGRRRGARDASPAPAILRRCSSRTPASQRRSARTATCSGSGLRSGSTRSTCGSAPARASCCTPTASPTRDRAPRAPPSTCSATSERRADAGALADALKDAPSGRAPAARRRGDRCRAVPGRAPRRTAEPASTRECYGPENELDRRAGPRVGCRRPSRQSREVRQ